MAEGHKRPLPVGRHSDSTLIGMLKDREHTRFNMTRDGYFVVKLAGKWYMVTGSDDDHYLLASLIEGLEHNGWTWSVESYDPPMVYMASSTDEIDNPKPFAGGTAHVEVQNERSFNYKATIHISIDADTSRDFEGRGMGLWRALARAYYAALALKTVQDNPWRGKKR